MWDQILGHQRVCDQLSQAISEDSAANAYLFTGPSGIGKSLVARQLAEALVAPGDARVAQGLHPDALWVAPDPEKVMRLITIDQIHQLQRQLMLHALEGKRKVAIIDEAETMRAEAANACLKILEEPPAGTHFILLSARPHQLLPTIISRCQRLRFAPLSPEVIMEFLQRTGMDSAEAKQRATFSEGSIGRAQDYSPELLTETLTMIHQLLQRPDAGTALDIAQQWTADIALLSWRLQLLAMLWRDSLAVRMAAQEKSTMPGTDGMVQHIAKRSARRLYSEIMHCLQLERESVMATFNVQLGCERLLLELAA